MRNELLNLLNELLICYFLIIFCGFKNWPVINTGLIEKNEKSFLNCKEFHSETVR